MTEHAGPRPTPAVPHDRQPVLRVVGGPAVRPARTGETAPPAPAARLAAARAAHPSSGAGVTGPRRLRLVTGDGAECDAGGVRLSREDLAVIIRIEEA